MAYFLGFVVLIIVVIFTQAMAHTWDKERIKKYIEDKGGELVSAEWTPFGKGWFGDENDRIYAISYLDKNKIPHSATVKTSLFSGVYITDDEEEIQPDKQPWYMKNNPNEKEMWYLKNTQSPANTQNSANTQSSANSENEQTELENLRVENEALKVALERAKNEQNNL